MLHNIHAISHSFIILEDLFNSSFFKVADIVRDTSSIELIYTLFSVLETPARKTR